MPESAPPPPALSAAQSVVRAEQMRADLAGFYGKPGRGIPLALDFSQAMYLSQTDTDLPQEAVQLQLDVVALLAAALDKAQVWVATAALTAAIVDHELVTSSDGYLLQNADEAPAPAGVLYFPAPITGASELPIHGLAWDVSGSGNDLELTVTALTATDVLIGFLDPDLVPNHRPGTQCVPNAIVNATPQYSETIHSYGHPPLWGAAPASILVGMLLAFWDLRTVFEYDEASIPTRARNGSRKRQVRFRRIRVVREPATRYTGEPTPSENEPKWAEETQRWTVPAKWGWRCPNPHLHKALIEAGGTCPKVRVRIREHTNGPLGRDLDPRPTVRIATARPADA